jgi:hypothetical protein
MVGIVVTTSPHLDVALAKLRNVFASRQEPELQKKEKRKHALQLVENGRLARAVQSQNQYAAFLGTCKTATSATSKKPGARSLPHPTGG